MFLQITRGLRWVELETHNLTICIMCIYVNYRSAETDSLSERRAELREKWQNMTSEQRQEFKEKWRRDEWGPMHERGMSPRPERPGRMGPR